MNKFARIISNIFSPLLVPTYGVAIALTTSFLALASMRVKVGVTAATFLITCLVPALIIALMWKLGKVSDPGLNKRTERTGPYILTCVSYLACAYYLWSVHAPMWLIMFIVGGALAAVIDLVVNRWWKISAHLTAMGGLLALVCRIATGSDIHLGDGMVWWVAAVAVACGAVASSRLILNRHTPLQTVAGFTVGFLCVFLLSLIN